MSYALLQMSLDQRIGLEDLQEASVAAPSVARGDCVQLSRELFGVVAENLQAEEARAFQQALAERKFPTKVVEQTRLFQLGQPRRFRGLRIESERLVLLDGIQREYAYRWNDIYFAAGGFLRVMGTKTERSFEWDYSTPLEMANPYGYRTHRKVSVKGNDRLVKEDQFRLEFFAGEALERLQITVDEERLLFLGTQRLRLRQRGALEALLKELSKRIPYERSNRGVHAAGEGIPIVYPSRRAFERELLWHFYRLTE